MVQNGNNLPTGRGMVFGNVEGKNEILILRKQGNYVAYDYELEQMKWVEDPIRSELQFLRQLSEKEVKLIEDGISHRE